MLTWIRLRLIMAFAITVMIRATSLGAVAERSSRRKSLRGEAFTSQGGLKLSRSSWLGQHDKDDIYQMRRLEKDDEADKPSPNKKSKSNSKSIKPDETSKGKQTDVDNVESTESRGDSADNTLQITINEEEPKLSSTPNVPSSQVPSSSLQQGGMTGTNDIPPVMTSPVAAANAATESDTSSFSSSSSYGGTIGIAASGMLLVLVLFFLAKQQRNKRKILVTTTTTTTASPKTSNMTSLEEGENGSNSDGDTEVYHEDECGPFEGIYKLQEHMNWNEFLQVLGVSWAARSAAIRAKPIQHITHKGDSVTIKFKGVPRVTYQIGRPDAVVVNMMGSHSFACRAKYTTNGFEVHKEALDNGEVDLHLRWSLSDDNETVRMDLTAMFTKDPAKQPVQCTQIYKRIGEF